MNLTDIFKKYIRTKDSGLLSIKIEGDNHLLKLYFERGEVVSISLGGCKNDECLKKMNKVIPVEYSFIKGVKPPARAVIPLTEKIMELTGITIPESGSETLHSGRNNNIIQPQMVTDLEEGFIEMIGPIGKMIIDNVFSEISYTRENPMPQGDYSHLLKVLTKKLPVLQQALFSNKYRLGMEE
ncbi:MAG: hypothetical protein AABY44_09575 [Nitrospirota bacterium]